MTDRNKLNLESLVVIIMSFLAIVIIAMFFILDSRIDTLEKYVESLEIDCRVIKDINTKQTDAIVELERVSRILNENQIAARKESLEFLDAALKLRK